MSAKFCRLPRSSALLLAVASSLFAQNIVLDNFNVGAVAGAVLAGTSWVGNVSTGPGTITVGGTALDDNGWGARGQSINATGMNYVLVTAQRDAGHAATTLTIQLEDRNLNTHAVTVSTASFASGTLTSVQIPLGTWPRGFDPTQIASWSIGGGNLGVTPFRMTFDQLELSASARPGAPVTPTVAGDFGPRTRTAGESIIFSVTATGSAPFTYQWRKNGGPVPGNASAATPALTLSNLNATDSGTYTCLVTNAAGAMESGAFVLTVSASSASISLGSLAQTYNGATHSVTTSTSPPGLPVTITYNGSPALPVNAGSYAVVAQIDHPSYTGRAAGTLVIGRAAQSIQFASLPTSLAVGTEVTLKATASSGGDVAFAVASGNARLSGASLTPLSAAPVTIRTTQVGDANYLPASVDLTFTTSKQNQSINFAPIAGPVSGTAPLTLTASASSNLPVTFDVISGPATLAGSTLTVTGTGAVIIRANQPGNDTFNPAPNVDRSFAVTAPPSPATAPTIARHPAPQTVAAGSPLTLFVEATGSDLSYQWYRDGVAIPGAQAASYTVAAASAATAGSYHVVITNSAGSARSAQATIVVNDAPPESRLINFSTRSRAGASDQVAIAGFAIAGDTPKQVLIRAVGPALAAFGVSGVLAAPKLELFQGDRSLAGNTGWSTAASPDALAAAAAQAGTFALAANSADSALLTTLAPGSYTAVISSADLRAGVGLIEVYDLSTPVRGQNIANLSIRASAGADADTLIVGMVVQGTSPKRMLVRAAGPALTQFGVSGALARPQLAVFSGSNPIARNAGWSSSSDAAAISQAAARAGAFAFAADSLDSALLLDLAPGAYTAQVSSPNGVSGVTLVEVYEAP